MKFMKNVVLAGVLAVSSLAALSTNAADEAAIKEKLSSTLGLEVDAIADSPVSGLVQVSTNRGLFYVSEDGGYLLQARVFNIDENMRNETEIALSSMRQESVREIGRAHV